MVIWSDPLTLKALAADALPPGLVTTIAAVLGPATNAAGTLAVSSVALPKVVLNGLPSSETCDPETKLEPLTARLKVGEPAATKAGERELMTGRSTLKGNTLLSAPPGLLTCTLTTPALTSKLDGTVAVSALELPKVVANGVEFHETCAPETKFVPATDSWKPGEPAAAEPGERLVRVGVRVPIVNVAMLDSVPPGLSTCTLACPAVVSRLAGTVTVSVVPVTTVGDNVVPRNTSCDPAR